MNQLYYPNFDVSDEDFLKYCLLSLDSLHSIIPDGYQDKYSERLSILLGETDLIIPYNPSYNNQANSTLRAIEEVEKILAKPIEYSKDFYTANVVDKWKNADEWNCIIYEKKYTETIHKFIEKEKIGCIDDHVGGLRVSPELYQLYMTILAGEISYQNSFMPVTDHLNYYRFSNRSRVSKEILVQDEHQIQMSYISFLPNIRELSVGEIIKFRNENAADRQEFNLGIREILANSGDVFDRQTIMNKFTAINENRRMSFLRLGSDTLRLSIKLSLTASDVTSNPLLFSEALWDAYTVSIDTYERFEHGNFANKKIMKGANFYANLESLGRK